MSSVTSADGTVIDYDSYGTGPAVVLVAGAIQHRAIDPGSTFAAGLLADDGYTVIVYDRRGRGRSGDTAPWALEREVEDLAALIKVAGGSALVYTSSAGAAVGLAASTAGIGVVGLVLYEPPFFPGEAKAEQRETVDHLLAQDDLEGALRFHMTEVIGVPAQAVQGMSMSPAWKGMASAARSLPYDYDALESINTDGDWSARWSAVRVPVSVYSGSKSWPGMGAAADSVVAALPMANRYISDGQDHNPSAEALAEAIRTSLPKA